MSLIPYAKATTTIGYFPGLHNARFLNDTLIAGGMPDDPRGYQTLFLMGIDLRINLTETSDEQVCKNHLIPGYLQLSVGELHPIHLDEMKDLILRVHTQWELGKKIFVGCKWGSDRTGYFVAAWRKWVDGWDMDVIKMELAMFASPMFNIEVWPGVRDRIDDLEQET